MKVVAVSDFVRFVPEIVEITTYVVRSKNQFISFQKFRLDTSHERDASTLEYS